VNQAPAVRLDRRVLQAVLAEAVVRAVLERVQVQVARLEKLLPAVHLGKLVPQAALVSRVVPLA